MSWFSKHFGIKLDAHSLPNLLKDISPAAGLIGGPAGIALAGGLSTLGDLGRGRNIGQAVKGSIGNAALGAGVGSLASHGFLGSGLQGFSGGSPAAVLDSTAGSTAGSAAGSVAPAATDAAPGAALPSVATDGAVTGAAAAPAPVTSALSLAPPGGFPALDSSAIRAATLPAATQGAGHGLLSTIGGFIEHNPNTAAMGLQGLGSLATAGSANAAARAQARLAGTAADTAQYELDRQKGQDKALDPFRAGLLGTLGTRLTQPVSRNPYLPAPTGG